MLMKIFPIAILKRQGRGGDKTIQDHHVTATARSCYLKILIPNFKLQILDLLFRSLYFLL